MKTYCPDCGTKIEFASKKPNFCPNCGHGLTVSKASSKPTPVDEKPDFDKEGLGFDVEYDAEGVPDFQSMKGLDYDFEPDSQNSETLGSIFKGSSMDVEPKSDVSTPRSEGPTAQQNMEQFRAEAGSLREKNSE